METHSFLPQALVYLAAGVIAVPVFRRLGLGSVLGYLVAGVVIGPWGLALISDPQTVLQFSEFGVVLLLFLIGLELNPQRVWSLRVELQPDQEQQQHHAELGELQHPLRIGDERESPRADRDAGDEVAEHRAQAKPAADRHGDDTGSEARQGLRKIAVRFHV